MSDFYPPLPDRAVWAVDIILQNMAQDPDYLIDSPYTHEEITTLERLAGNVSTLAEEAEEIEEVGDGKWARLERESDKLFKALTGFSAKLDAKDNAETMAYFRTATSLLDKIVGIQERTANLKQISMFHDTVLRVMEDVLDAGQRTEVMTQLKKAINPNE